MAEGREVVVGQSSTRHFPGYCSKTITRLLPLECSHNTSRRKASLLIRHHCATRINNRCPVRAGLTVSETFACERGEGYTTETFLLVSITQSIRGSFVGT